MRHPVSTTILALILASALVAACDRGPRSGPSATAPVSEDVLYVVEGPSAPAAVGSKQDVAFKIKAKPGWKINKEYDWSIDFEGGDGVVLETTEVGSSEIILTDAEAQIPVELQASRAGRIDIPAKGNFSICNETKCELYQNTDLTFVLAAQ